MPYRNLVFTNEEIYHVYNRAVAKIPIFKQKRDCERYLNVIDYYRYNNTPFRYSFLNRLNKEQKENTIKNLHKENSRLVEIYAYCLMPNHFHFLVKQLEFNGIAGFMRNIQNSYAKYINTKYNRTGALFQALFKAVRIETTEQLLHVSRYIHLNPVLAYIISIEQLEQYLWSSFPDYIKEKEITPFINTRYVLENFKSPIKYKEFVFDQADYQRELEDIKHLTFDD